MDNLPKRILTKDQACMVRNMLIELRKVGASVWISFPTLEGNVHVIARKETITVSTELGAKEEYETLQGFVEAYLNPYLNPVQPAKLAGPTLQNLPGCI